MTVEWIEHLWIHGQSRYIAAKDGKWEEFKCPIFLGCSVCVTGFGSTERNRIQKLVTKFGGIYSGAMKLDFTTHLVVHKPEGQKYMMASKFGVKVVNVDWVYKSIEKGSCQDHSKYPVKASASPGPSTKPHSSTPEQTASSARIPSIQDMSNISVVSVNETAMTMGDVSTFSTIGFPLSVTQNHNDKEDLMNFRVNPNQEQILDGVCIYVAGFSIKEEEKIRQLLSICGATRYNQLTASVSHVIASGNIPEQTATTIQAALSKPGRELWVVSYRWLIASLQKNEVLSEIDYWMREIVPEPSHLSKVENRDEMNEDDEVTFMQLHPKRNIETKINEDVQVTTVQRADMTTMQDVLSQYMVNDDANNDGFDDDETTLLRNFKMEPNNANGSKDAEPLRSDADDETHLHDATDATQENSSRWSLFRDKTFIVLGFNEDSNEKCIDNIESLGGRILPVYSKRVADYAIVPLTGWSVDRTVQNIVTNFWIDLCINNGCVVDIDVHPMCTPFLVSPDTMPLEGCVACLSKYQEPERSHLVSLIQELGGIYQDNVVRKNMGAMHRTTHLIVMAPEGDKYIGSKKWGIHTVSAEWVLECARQGVRVSESQFCVDKLNENNETSQPVEVKSAVSTTTSESETKSKVTTSASVKDAGAPSDSENLEFPPMPRPPSVVDHIRRRLEAKAEAQRAKEQETPLREKVLRLNMETPSKFLSVGANPKISFQLDEVFALLKTPAHEQKKVKEAIKSNPETPLSEFVERFLAESLKNVPEIDDNLVTNLEKVFDSIPSEDERNDTRKNDKPETPVTKIQNTALTQSTQIEPNPEDAESTGADPAKPLIGVTVYVCKKLTKQRMELSDVVTELGGEFRWTYDAACTHFIFQGKQNDTNREFRTARSQNKKIVSPYWVTSCKEARCRLDEQDFPHVYNPNKSIQMVQTSSQASVRSRRSSRLSVATEVSTRNTRSTRKRSSTENHEPTESTTKVDSGNSEASQEVRDRLKKTLENIMSSTSSSKQAKALNDRLSGNRSGGFASPAHLVPPLPRISSPSMEKKTEAEKPDSSQDVHVVWDDPIGRGERERIMRENDEKSRSSLSDNSKQTDSKQPEVTTDEDVSASSNQKHDPNEQNQITEHPKEELPLADDNRLSQIIRDGKTPAFLISSVTPEQKIEYAAVIESLGGIYLDRDYFDRTCTHLVVKKPARNEKFLACLSSGKWILHTSYIEACKDAGVFVKEDNHEYGNPLASWLPSNETESALVSAAFRWRRKLLMKKQSASDGSKIGAFCDWKVILHVSDRQTPGFARLLQSGSASVVGRSLPYQGSIQGVTHAIIDPNRTKQLPLSEIETLHRAGIHCCVPEYIAVFLMKDPPPNIEDYYLPVVREILDDGEGTPRKKRRIC